jgi:predicted nucleic acid-binding protein
MLIISDTSPMRYLVEIEVIDVLPRLYGHILTTPNVMDELRLDKFPTVVSQWASRPPNWLVVESPAQIRFLDILDAGEASALSLALQRAADFLLVDERKATRVARDNGMRTAGTLAVLHDAGIASLIDFHASLDRLTKKTQFHHTPALIAQVIANFEREFSQRSLP